MSDDETSTILQRFSALAISEGLGGKKSKRYKERRREFIIEEVNAGFEASFGGNIGSLGAWKNICYTVGVTGSEEFTSIRQCKAALDGEFVNIVDLVDAGSKKVVMKAGVFRSARALSRYIKRTGKFYPKGKAKANPLLRKFLITLE